MARLDLYLLGPFQATIETLPIGSFGTDKNRALLAYVCVEGSHPHRRETLTGLLWPEQSEEAARTSLRQALYKLRQALSEQEGDGAHGFLQVNPQVVQLDPSADYWLDVAEFIELVAACRSHRHRKPEHCSFCHSRLLRAAELYRGDFFQGFFLEDSQPFDEWLVLKREGLRRSVLEVFRRLATRYEARGEYEQALHYAYRQVDLEPWLEEVHRQLMRLLAATGRRAAALAQYDICRERVKEALGVEPDDETTALYERIRNADQESGVGSQESVIDSDSRLPTPDSPKHNLPRPLMPLIGRDAELARIVGQLDSPDCFLITIVGPGGVGKTRLALQSAREQVGTFDDGVYWVSLASINSMELLATSIAQAIGLHFEGAQDPAVQLVSYLHDKEMLLVLDNFEQFLARDVDHRGDAERKDATDLLLSILKGAPRISMLVTSRERLGLQAEFLLDLSGLPFPEIAGEVRDDDLANYGAVQLFVERAQLANPGFQLTSDNAQEIGKICGLVAGLPLGIVLAAAWVRHFSPGRIAASIGANLDFLASAARDAAPQHVSLRAAFNHSWDLLTDEEKRVLRGLSVFHGGWEEEAARITVGAEIRALVSLVDKSLLRQSALGRFDIHEVLRQYAAEKLDELPDEREEIQRRYAEYYLELAELASKQMLSGEQEKWLELLEREHNNLRAAISWAREKLEVELGLRLAGALLFLWFVRGYYREGREVLDSMLALPVPSAEAEGAQPPSMKAARARALQAAGDLSRALADYDAARRLCEESLALYRELGNKQDISVAVVRLAIAIWSQGDRATARSLYEEGLALSRELGNKRDISIALGNLGLMAFEDGDYATARLQLEESLMIARELGNKFTLAIRLNNLGNVALMQGDLVDTRALHTEALALRRSLGDKWGVAISLVGLGGAAILEGNVEKGTRLLGAADSLLNSIGATLEADDRIPFEYGVASARAQLSEESFKNSWAEGGAMSMEQAIDYALEASASAIGQGQRRLV